MRTALTIQKVSWEVLVGDYGHKGEFSWKARFCSDDAVEQGYTFIVESTAVFDSENKAKADWGTWRKGNKITRFRYIKKENW